MSFDHLFNVYSSLWYFILILISKDCLHKQMYTRIESLVIPGRTKSSIYGVAISILPFPSEKTKKILDDPTSPILF